MFNRRRAAQLHEKAIRLRGDGDDEGALRLYFQALELDPDRPATLYNIGLIHKYRRDWRASFEFNRRAFALRPEDEAIRWNLGIAATALGDWPTARKVWSLCGFEIGEGEGPIVSSFGRTPVRLNPDEDGEVVWAERIDPVRARIRSVPFPGGGFFFGDVVLHDGAATGYRLQNGQEKPVFNVFERLERSAYSTAEVDVSAPSQPDIDELEAACEAAGMPFEDWTTSVKWLCRQCSEGVPHDEHDQDLPEPVWIAEHETGVAFLDEGRLTAVLEAWAAGPARAVRAVRIADWPGS